MKKINWTRKVFFCFVVFIANLPVAQILFPFWALTRIVCRRLVRLVFAFSWYWLCFSNSFLRKDMNKAIEDKNSCENRWRYQINVHLSKQILKTAKCQCYWSTMYRPNFYESTCFRCKEIVYQVDRIGPLKDFTFFHTGCFKCKTCGSKLTLKTYFNSQLNHDDKEVRFLTSYSFEQLLQLFSF